MAFAASDAHAAARGSPFAPLSVEFAHYYAARRLPTFEPHRGVPLRVMADTIRHDGQPLELGWPYLPHLPKNLSQYKPPADPGTLYRRESQNWQPSVDAICTQIDAGNPVIVIIQPTLAFHFAAAGTVVHDAPNDPVSAAPHAVIAVGHGVEGSVRTVLLRNSWGPGWGDAGCIWVGEDYLAPRLYQVSTME
jgi:hypothetical protein